jgi:hypothetical protein
MKNELSAKASMRRDGKAMAISLKMGCTGAEYNTVPSVSPCWIPFWLNI